MEEKQNAVLGTAPLGRLMLKFALPCTVSLLVGALYNIVDQIFIGWGVMGAAAATVAAFIFMQAMGRPVESAGLSFFREVLLAVPLVMLLPKAFGLMGVLYSMPAADILTFFASGFVLLRTDRQLRK